MKRYLVFFGDIYYPSGGMGDFIGDFDTVEEGKKAIEGKVLESINDFDISYYGGRQQAIESEWDGSMIWASIYDTAERKTVFSRSSHQ